MSNEITLKIKCSIDEFYNILEEKKFKIVDRFFLDDTYFVSKDIDIHKLKPREILKKYILIRNITQYIPNEYKVIKMTYKTKDILSNGDIINQENIDCKIDNIENGIKFVNAIGYKRIMNIKEDNVSYMKDGLRIDVKDVKNGDKLIEIETVKDNADLNTIDKLKEKVTNLKLPIDTDDYFVKKAEIELEKIL